MSSPKESVVHLPLSKIKTIMKSSPDVENIGMDAVFCMSKAAELFVTYLTAQAFQRGENGSSIEYGHLADIVNNDEDDVFGFLQEIIPRKITMREYYKIMKKEQEEEDSTDTSEG